MALIAGHDFGLSGFCTYTTNDNSSPCGKTFADISMATKDNIGELGWAHYGKLNESEYNDIEKERERIWAAHKIRDMA